MNISEFNINARKVLDWIVKYFETIESYPVKSQVKPREIFDKLTDAPPYEGENFNSIFEDFNKIIIPGISHWQSPNFFAYFPTNTSFPSILAEMLSAALDLQCMKWETSPAATELEEKVMNWLRDLIGLPPDFTGVIQDTASTSTLTALLTAREKFSDHKINKSGFKNHLNFRVYASSEAHSSVEKAVKISGIGSDNLVKISVNSDFSVDTDDLKNKIKKDIANGYKPLFVVATLGTTGCIAIDSIKEVGNICKENNIWFHVDAAYLGTALILPEYHYLIEGIENADSFVFNPHKWMFTNFDCSAYFIKNKSDLIKTFEMNPEYLKTQSDLLVNNYCDWGIPLGRRFRALKLWFVLRCFGVSGLQNKIREQIEFGKIFYEKISNESDFELLAPRTANTICFRYKPADTNDLYELNALNEKLMNELNASGKIYISHTKLNDIYTLRMIIAQTNVTLSHVNAAFELILKTARSL